MRVYNMLFREHPLRTVTPAAAQRLKSLLPVMAQRGTFAAFRIKQVGFARLQEVCDNLNQLFGTDRAHLLDGSLIREDGRSYAIFALLGDWHTTPQMLQVLNDSLGHVFVLGNSKYHVEERSVLMHHFHNMACAALAEDVPLSSDVHVLYRELKGWKAELVDKQQPLLPEYENRLVRLAEVLYGLGPTTSVLFQRLARATLDELARGNESLSKRLEAVRRPLQRYNGAPFWHAV